MQVIAPDFAAPTGTRSTAREGERSNNGFFDTLLREEESRHDPAPEERREAARPARDDFYRDEAPREQPRYDEPEREEVVREEQPAREEHLAEEASAEDARKDAPLQEDSRPKETESDNPATAEAAPAASGAATVAATAATAGPAAAGPKSPASSATVQAGAPVAPQQTAQSNAPSASTAEKPSQATTSQQPPTTSAKAPEAAVKTAINATTPQQATDNKLALDGAKAPQSGAAAERPATTTPQQTALSQTTPAQPAQPGEHSVASSKQTTGLESRPSAALGGAATSIALAQEGAAKPTKPSAPAPAAAANDAPGLQSATGRPAAPANQIARNATSGVLPAAASDKFAGATPAVKSSSGDSAGLPGSQNSALGSLPGAAGSTAPAQQSSFAETLASTRHAPTTNPAEQIAMQVQRAQVAGQDQISIKLHPAELGRIEVKLENASDGTLRAVISAERSETLDLLQRDARGLERALQEAGVKTDSGSLNFNLRGQGQEHRTADNGGSRATHGGQASDSAETAPAPAAAYRSSHNGTLDIRV